MSATAKHSFDLKMDRAERHLIDFKKVVSTFANSHPYTVRTVRHGTKKTRVVRRLHFTAAFGPEASLIAADFIYNVRSGLEHLAASIVPASVRDSVMFPVFFKGVEGPDIPGENVERTKMRRRWETYTRKMNPDAVAFLASIQPDEAALDYAREGIYPLVALNRLSNTDRHNKLPVLLAGLAHARTMARLPNGDEILYEDPADVGSDGLEDGAELVHIPKDAVYVQIEGTPVVVIRVVQPQGNLPVPDTFDHLLKMGRVTADQLRGFVKRQP